MFLTVLKTAGPTLQGRVARSKQGVQNEVFPHIS